MDRQLIGSLVHKREVLMSGLISILTSTIKRMISRSAGFVDGAKLRTVWLQLFAIWFCANILNFFLATDVVGSAVLNFGLAAGMVALLHLNARIHSRGLVA